METTAMHTDSWTQAKRSLVWHRDSFLGRFGMGLQAESSDPLEVNLDVLRREGDFMAGTDPGDEAGGVV